jgi:hypothetical protein
MHETHCTLKKEGHAGHLNSRSIRQRFISDSLCIQQHSAIENWLLDVQLAFAHMARSSTYVADSDEEQQDSCGRKAAGEPATHKFVIMTKLFQLPNRRD